MNLKRFLFTLALVLFSPAAFGESRDILERPIMLGPQYPLIFMSTIFEPDSAFLLPKGELFFQTSYALLNTWGYSSNAYRDENGVQFNPMNSERYSVYFDSEADRRVFRFHYGISERFELQTTYRDIRFIPGTLDPLVENFHKAIHIGTAGRERTEQNLTEIYIHDNRSQQNVFEMTETSDDFKRESVTLGFKYLVRKTAQEAISLSLSSNCADYYIEKGINQIEESEDSSYQDFNDWNLSLRYASLFADWSLHAALSVSFIQRSLFQQSPREIYFFFVGGDWRLSESFDFIFQFLEYSSPFPSNNISTLSEDVIELSAALRWLPARQFAFELGAVENQSQGPQNIDIAIFTDMMFHF